VRRDSISKFLKILAAASCAALLACGDDSSTNPQAAPGSTANEGAFRVARPAKYETKGGINYFTYYWGKCTIVNGVYSWNPMGEDDIFAYTISGDSLKTYYRSTEEYENDSPLDPDVDFFMYGGNKDNSLWGTWAAVHCGIRDGVYTCRDAQLYNTTYEFKQDSVIAYMTIDPNYVLVTEAIHDILEEYFDICLYDYEGNDDDGYPQDIPQKGITFSNLTKNSGTITIGGQSISVGVNAFTTTTEVRYLFKVSSNGTTCSNDVTFGYVNKPEFCSESYKEYLSNDHLDMNGTDTVETYYLRGRGNQVEYENCLKNMLSSNPAFDPDED